MPDTEYIFIDAWYSSEADRTVVAISRTYRNIPTRRGHFYNPSRSSILRLASWIKESGAKVRPWNFQIGWAATLTIEPPEKGTNDA